MERTTEKCDVLIIGGATAGCFAAIYAKRAGADVLVIDKNTAGRSGSSIMVCGFWNYVNPEWGDDLEGLLEYTNKNSSYLNNRDWSRTLLEDSWGTVEDLYDFGVELPCKKEDIPGYFLGQLEESIKISGGGPAHTNFDHVGTKGYGQCPTGFRKITPQLRKYAQSIGVRFIDRVMVTDLVMKDGSCVGAVGFDIEDAKPYLFNSKLTLLAAGKNTFKGPGMGVNMQTGDAQAMAFRAGAVMTGGEFPDMHTTLALHPYWKSNGGEYATYQCYTRSEGDKIVPWRGFDLGMVSAFHDGQGPVYWDLSQATTADKALWDENEKRRNAPQETGRAGVDIHNGKPYTVAGGAVAGGQAEQSCGCWLTDLNCATTIPGLYAAGDAGCTWAWGAILNGPPPGLMPAGVTGKRAGIAMGDICRGMSLEEPDEAEVSKLFERMYEPLNRKGGFTPDYATPELQHICMPYYVIHIKQEERLKAVLELLKFHAGHISPMIYARDAHELRMAHEYRNMVLNAQMIFTAALERRESRGWHFREDYPARNDDEQLSWIRYWNEDGEIKVDRVPVPEEWKPDRTKSEDELYDRLWFAWDHKD